MTSAARAVARLTMKDPVAERHLIRSIVGRDREWGGASAGVRMRPLGRRRQSGLDRDDRGRRRGGNLVRAVSIVGDAPDPAMNVVGNVERAVRALGYPGWTERRPAWVLVGSGKAVRENHKGARGLAVGKRLEDDVIPALGQGRSIPRPVERDEGAAAIAGRERRPVIDSQVVGGPVPWEGGDRRLPLRADPDRLAAIAAVFRRKHQLILFLVIIALGPAIVGAGDELNQFLGRQIRALRRRIEARPILKELIATVLGRE